MTITKLEIKFQKDDKNSNCLYGLKWSGDLKGGYQHSKTL